MNGMLEGHGVLYYEFGDRYEGNWVNGNKEGHGVYYFVRGSRYVGNFVNGK